MASGYKIGDIVVLKSGGPKMTVTKIMDDGVWTLWFAGAKKDTAYFPFDAISPASAEEPKKK